MSTTTYTVSGMTCQHCVSHVTEEVAALPAVDDVKVTLDDGRMVVQSNAPVPFDDIAAAVAEAGDYSVALA